jgi:hypothetical protein
MMNVLYLTRTILIEKDEILIWVFVPCLYLINDVFILSCWIFIYNHRAQTYKNKNIIENKS